MVLNLEIAIVALVSCIDDKGIFVEPMEAPVGFYDKTYHHYCLISVSIIMYLK